MAELISTQKSPLLFEIRNHPKLNWNNTINYIDVNFETQDFINRLKQKNFNPNQKTLYMWEGVTYYLNEKSVLSVLKRIRSESKSNSKIYLDAYDTIRDDDRTAKQAMNLLRTLGEPICSCISIETTKGWNLVTVRET